MASPGRSFHEMWTEHITAPGVPCDKCGHHMENHEYIMGARACMWCSCGHRPKKWSTAYELLPEWLHATFDSAMIHWEDD